MGSFRDVREAQEEPILEYLRDAVERFSKDPLSVEIFGYNIPNPFIYLYPLAILEQDNAFYKAQFKKDGKKWHMPSDLSTSCFFAIIDDLGQAWWPFGWPFNRKIYMRISGASLIMGEASARFEHRVINMLYYSGLYRMTRVERHTEPTFVCNHGLEPLLEQQGAEIANVFTQRTTEERLTTLNKLVLIFTLIVAISTITLIISH